MAGDVELDEENLKLAKPSADTAFRAEMAMSNFFLGYWRHMAAAVGVGLIGVLLYGQWKSWESAADRKLTGDVAAALEALPEGVPLSQLAFRLQQDPTVMPADKLVELGDKLLAMSQTRGGTSAAEAALDAAELFRLAKNAEKRRAALTRASEAGPGAIAFTARMALAHLELEGGNGDAALTALRQLATDPDAFLAQQATLDLGLALEHLGQKEEAGRVYADFLVKWPDAASAGEVKTRQAALDANSAAPAPAAAPADPTPATAPPAGTVEAVPSPEPSGSGG